MILRKGDTIQLVFTFTDKDGDAIDLTGHTVRFIAYNMLNPSVFLFQEAVTSFTGENSNIATFSWTDEETTLWNPVEYRWFVQLETAAGQEYNSRKGFLRVSAERATKADYRLIFGGDNIICEIEDDVTIPGGEEPVVGTFSATFSATFA